jgi:hypothetical protein
MLIYESGRHRDVRDAKRASGKRADWRGVKVIATDQCCREAQEFSGRHFLTAEAPLLPLPSCTQKYCACRYRHFADRRIGARRLAERAALPRRISTERRGLHDRRAGEERG